MLNELSSVNKISATQLQVSGFAEGEPITEITPALIQAVADLVYARLLADVTIDRERRPIAGGRVQFRTGGWR